MTSTTWQDADRYDREYLETDDPRVLAVIEQEMQPSAPYGDALAPAYYVEFRHEWRTDRAGEVFHDDESDTIASRYADAMDRFAYRYSYTNRRAEYTPHGRDERVARWLRIFHDTTTAEASDGQGNRVVIFNTPSYRAHVGMTDATAEAIQGERAEWQSYLDGDVWGIGYAVNPARVLADEPVNFDDFEVSIECWGFYGRKHATESAAEFEAGTPDLPEMLALPELVDA